MERTHIPLTHTKIGEIKSKDDPKLTLAALYGKMVKETKNGKEN